MRCFVAAFVEPACAERLRAAFLTACADLTASADLTTCAEAQGGVPRRSMRQVPVANYHVTLKFIGETAETAVPELLDAVSSLQDGTVQAEVWRFIGFPKATAARLAVGELRPEPRLQAWATQLEAALGVADRAFRPHVTVARFDRPGGFDARALDQPLPLELQAPALYRSEQTGGGVRYVPLAAPSR